MSASKKPVLPGQSRSTSCRTKSCSRLQGHKGSHRPTLSARPSTIVVTAKPSPKVTKLTATEGGVEVLSADRYTVIEDDACCQHCSLLTKSAVPAKARKTVRRTVRKVAFVAPKERVGISGPVGRPKVAKRPRIAPKGRRDVTIAEQLQAPA